MTFCNKIRRESNKNFECKLVAGHKGKCNPYPFLKDLDTKKRKNLTLLDKLKKKIAKKIKQDAYHTRGNKTKPFKNRSYRWDTTISQVEALKMKKEENKGIPKKEYATQENCFQVAQKLTRLVYEMANAPDCPEEVVSYLDKKPDAINNPCVCPLCRKKLDINDFDKTEWGQAIIELWHINPLSESSSEHNAQNVAWGHRICNIAQGERSTSETLIWMREIINNNDNL